jgi:hypothetical protein
MSSSQRNDSPNVTYKDLLPEFQAFKTYLTAVRDRLANETSFQDNNYEFRLPGVIRLIVTIENDYLKQMAILVTQIARYKQEQNLSQYAHKFEALKNNFVKTIEEVMDEEKRKKVLLTREPVEKGFVAFLHAQLILMPESGIANRALQDSKSSSSEALSSSSKKSQ